jgi:hypothetical protein
MVFLAIFLSAHATLALDGDSTAQIDSLRQFIASRRQEFLCGSASVIVTLAEYRRSSIHLQTSVTGLVWWDGSKYRMDHTTTVDTIGESKDITQAVVIADSKEYCLYAPRSKSLRIMRQTGPVGGDAHRMNPSDLWFGWHGEIEWWFGFPLYGRQPPPFRLEVNSTKNEVVVRGTNPKAEGKGVVEISFSTSHGLSPSRVVYKPGDKSLSSHEINYNWVQAGDHFMPSRVSYTEYTDSPNKPLRTLVVEYSNVSLARPDKSIFDRASLSLPPGTVVRDMVRNKVFRTRDEDYIARRRARLDAGITLARQSGFSVAR